MKKYLFLILAAVSMLFVSCGSVGGKATVEIGVTKLGLPVAGETVYQFSSQKFNQPAFVQPIHADRQSVTDEAGVATFDLKGTFDLDVIDDQTTLYYVVFAADKKTVAGQTAVTIRKGETKRVTIRL